MYTIKDLSNRKVALVNDGTLEELREVLRLAFPISPVVIITGVFKYYFADIHDLQKWDNSDIILILPTQSVKDFIKQIRGKEIKTNLEKIEDILFSNVNSPFVDPSINTYSDEKVQPNLDRLKQEMKEQEEFKLPEKWCVLGDKQEVIDYSNIYGVNAKQYKLFINTPYYHHYPSFYFVDSLTTTYIDPKDDYTEITFEQFKKYVLKEEIKEQEYELVDFKIEDLKVNDVLESTNYKLEILYNFGKAVVGLVHNKTDIYSESELRGCKLQIPKKKLEKIQGFEVRKYPELPLVEVSDDEYFPSFNVSIVQLKEVLEGNSTPFFDGNSVWGFCRPVPKERRNFIEIEKD